MKWKTCGILAGLTLVGAVCLSAMFVYATLVTGQKQPAGVDGNQEIFQGITYEKIQMKSPRPVVMHIVTIDLRAPGIAFTVTPGDAQEELPLVGMTTSQFLEKFKLQLAINGDGFTPWRSNPPLDIYPRKGERVQPNGMAASLGKVYSQGISAEPVLYLSRTNRAAFNTPAGKIYNAISGDRMLVVRGLPAGDLDSKPEPRSAVAIDRRGRRLILVVVDGRQPGYSEGATLQELADWLIDAGGYFGMNLDGGGSSTLVMEGEGGKPVVMNSPIDQNIQGKERVVGNHLGISAESLGK